MKWCNNQNRNDLNFNKTWKNINIVTKGEIQREREKKEKEKE